VDYEAILERAEAEADVIVWDGGNNDFPFYRPDLHIVLTDALRPHDADRYHPGEATLRMADVVVVAKTDAASADQIQQAESEARALNPTATIVRGVSPVTLDDPEAVRGRRTLVVDDGPTLTHGGMAYGAGYVAAVAAGAEIVDPRPYLAPSIREALERYPHVRSVLPALGYGAEQLAALAETIAATPAEVVVAGTPIDLGALVEVSQPIVRARYEFAEAPGASAGAPGLGSVVDAMLQRVGLASVGGPQGLGLRDEAPSMV
jgi:predicted GTPase